MLKNYIISVLIVFVSFESFSQNKMFCLGSDFLVYGFTNEIDLSATKFDSVNVIGATYWRLAKNNNKVLLVYPEFGSEVTVQLFDKNKLIAEQIFKTEAMNRHCSAYIYNLKTPNDKIDQDHIMEETSPLILEDSTFILKVSILRNEEYLNIRFWKDNRFMVRSISFMIIEGRTLIKTLNIKYNRDNVYNLDSLKNFLKPGRRIVVELNNVQSINGFDYVERIFLTKNLFTIPIFKDEEAYNHFVMFGE